MSEIKTTNIVNVVHLEDAEKKWYTFGVPGGVTLKKDDYVQVHGNQICRCVTDSAEVDDKMLEMIMRGQKLISEITGIYTYTKTKDIGKSVADNYDRAVAYKRGAVSFAEWLLDSVYYAMTTKYFLTESDNEYSVEEVIGEWEKEENK